MSITWSILIMINKRREFVLVKPPVFWHNSPVSGIAKAIKHISANLELSTELFIATPTKVLTPVIE
jgi:hypothetical protein